MPRVGAIKRRNLIEHLDQLGFAGPFSGHRHEFITRGGRRVIIPNPHQGTSASIYLYGFSGRPGSAATNGKRYS